MRRPRREKPRIEGLESRRFLAITPVGPQLQVNTTTTGDQFAPSIASDSAGNFVVAWVDSAADGSGAGIFAQRYASSGITQGSQFLVNTITTGAQIQPEIARNASGAFVVTWASNGEIMARRFDASGAALDATEFQVNTYTTGTQSSPVIAVEADGDFVIAWNSNGQDGAGYGVYARRYNSAGVAQEASEFLVNQTTSGLQADPAIAIDLTGDFVIAWTSGTLAGASQYDIYARRYDSAGAAMGSEFQVNAYTTDYQVFADVAMDTAGDFVVVWQSYGQDGLEYGVYARRYDSSGAALGSEFLANTFTAGKQFQPAVAMNPNGAFTIAWTSQNQDGSGLGIYARGYSSAGNPAGLARLVNVVTTNDQSRPDVAVSSLGYATIAFQDQASDGSGTGLLAQRFGPARVLSADYNANLRSLVIVFSEDVSASFTLADFSTAPVISSSSMNLVYNTSTNTATIDFFPGYLNGILPNGNYEATLSSVGITDFAGTTLDGDNNGTAGGNHVFDFFVLAADANRDRIVNKADLGIMALNWHGTGRTFTQSDFNYDGRIDVHDLLILALHWLQSLPEPAPPLLAPAVAMTSRTSPSRTATRVNPLLA